MEEIDPPFHEAYNYLFETARRQAEEEHHSADIVEACELPVIDLARLTGLEREECVAEMVRASEEWGFFQVVNHGISREILDQMRHEQMKVFHQPFVKKREEVDKFSPGTYRWGTPTATCLKQLAWSEAFHIPMTDISASQSANRSFNSLSTAMEEFATTVADLAQKLAEILAENLGRESSIFKDKCVASSCYLRMNRYPPCALQGDRHVFGLMPHTDSDFLTILYQDHVGGLQLVRDGNWFAVNPNPKALIINIGDLFQAWSNDVYKSVEHRVMTNSSVERFSTAYFFCPSYDTEINSVYRKFSFREYREKVQEDVQKLGYKVGLPRFNVHPTKDA
ncbi:Gibberellin 2-beta-dioxygenase 8 [Linum grandiflorum]